MVVSPLRVLMLSCVRLHDSEILYMQKSSIVVMCIPLQIVNSCSEGD